MAKRWAQFSLNLDMLQLGLEPSQLITLSYGRLFDEWRSQTGSTASDLTFAAISNAANQDTPPQK
jgi:hypothetical protein